MAAWRLSVLWSINIESLLMKDLDDEDTLGSYGKQILSGFNQVV